MRAYKQLSLNQKDEQKCTKQEGLKEGTAMNTGLGPKGARPPWGHERSERLEDRI